MEGSGNVVEVEPDSNLYCQVVELSNRNKATLGFLPYQVFREAAASERLLADVAGGVVRGYILFRIRMRTGDIALSHLCVGRDYRGQGVARTLIEDLVARYPNSSGIRLRCRNDFDAHFVWPKLGFESRGERLGRSRYLLTDWWRRIADWSLFDWAEQRERRVVVVLDTDVFRDIAEQRQFLDSLALESDWVEDLVDLTITSKALDQVSGSDGRSPDLRPKACRFRILEPLPGEWQPIYEKLLTLEKVATSGQDDMQIIAQAIAGKARYLITRDQVLIRSSEEIEGLYGLAILEPASLIMHLSADDDYQPQFIANSRLRIEQLHSIPGRRELRRYCRYVGQRPIELRQKLASAVGSAADSAQYHELTDGNGTGLALTAHYLTEGKMQVTVLRRSSSRNSYSVMRQIIYFLRVTMARAGGGRIEISDHIDDIIERALQDEGFQFANGSWAAETRVTVTGHGDPLPVELESKNLTPSLISQFEGRYWPCKVFTGVVPSYVVPIRPGFAKAILGYEEAQRELFGPPLSVAIARENVYYRRQRGSLEVPGRILWWVSGGGREGGMRAMSWLEAVDTGSPERLYRLHGRRGILTLDQITERAGKARRGGRAVATALLFSRTEIFPDRVSIERSRQLYEPMIQNGYFQSSRRVEESVAGMFYREGRSTSE